MHTTSTQLATLVVVLLLARVLLASREVVCILLARRVLSIPSTTPLVLLSSSSSFSHQREERGPRALHICRHRGVMLPTTLSVGQKAPLTFKLHRSDVRE